MIEGFGYKDQFLGTGDLASYTFDLFVYDPSHLHIYIQDQYGNILHDTNGADTAVVASLVLDTINGGGTLTLAENLGNNYTLTILIANDEPSQPSDFPNKNSFTLDIIEGALDFIATCVQRAAYLAQRAIRLHDLDDIDGFDMRLPQNLSSYPDAFLQINDQGSGFAVGPTQTQLVNQAIAGVMTTLLVEINQIIASLFPNAVVHTGPWTVLQGSNFDLTAEVTDHTVQSQVDFTARIQRGTLVFARQEFSIFYRNGGWEIAIGPERYADAAQEHGVTFSVNSATGQINDDVANDGAGDATIDLYKLGWPA